ncbi:MAG TPA: acetolactate synthase small subunit [Gammaproteobacteria bacterium]|nr:acetolactate synthase small subunit [Gammaproteobacteria bacterium]HAU06387.1 acetolactate synthase small subunit [Gammaproteobacteria bacterium]
MRHVISILLENEAGALSRVAGLFSARAYNIESLTVATTEDPSLSRMTVVTSGTERVIEQIIKQLNKLIDVVKLVNLTDGPHIELETVLVKLKADNTQALLNHIDNYQGQVIKNNDKVIIVQLTSSGKRIDEFIQTLLAFEIIETVRSGVSGMLCDTI